MASLSPCWGESRGGLVFLFWGEKRGKRGGGFVGIVGEKGTGDKRDLDS